MSSNVTEYFWITGLLKNHKSRFSKIPLNKEKHSQLHTQHNETKKIMLWFNNWNLPDKKN